MENEPSSEATPFKPPRLYGIVHAYIQNQLPRDIHPAFKALRDREEAATLPPQIRLPEEITLISATEREHESQMDQMSPNKDDDDDVPLYAASQGKRRSVVDLVKRRII